MKVKVSDLDKEKKNKLRSIVEWVKNNSPTEEEFNSKYGDNMLIGVSRFRVITRLNKEGEKQEEFKVTEEGESLLKGEEPLNIRFMSEQMDYLKIAEDYVKIYPLIYNKYKLWWKWSTLNLCWERVDETDLMLSINKLSDWNGVINQKIKNQLLNALMLCGRERFNNLKKPKKSWIQFKNKIIDINTEEEIEPNPNYFIVNRIPWSLGESEETPVMDKILSGWNEDIYLLKEIMSYCLISDNPIHRIYCLFGKGRNGKGRYQALIERVVGMDNCTTTEIDRLQANPRFETSRLQHKNVCFLGETTHKAITRSDTIKKISGNDLVPVEWKGSNNTENVKLNCRLIMGTNAIPMSNDRTFGYASRWLIVKFDSVYRKGKDILETIPEIEYNNFCRQSIKILRELLKRGEFKGEKSYEEKEKELEELSNPIMSFIKNCCKEDFDEEVPKFLFENKLIRYCKLKGLRRMSYKEINTAMKEEGYEDIRKRTLYSESENPIFHWLGLSIDEDKIIAMEQKMKE